jgi:hypothetical protein
MFILGHARRDTLTIPAHWHETKLLRHGDSIMRFFRKSQTATVTSSEPASSTSPVES